MNYLDLGDGLDLSVRVVEGTGGTNGSGAAVVYGGSLRSAEVVGRVSSAMVDWNAFEAVIDLLMGFEMYFNLWGVG